MQGIVAGKLAKEKEALTLEQQEKLLKFVEQSNVYKPHLPMMQVMFGACLRVSEARKIKASQNLHKIISTHLLTVLTKRTIT